MCAKLYALVKHSCGYGFKSYIISSGNSFSHGQCAKCLLTPPLSQGHPLYKEHLVIQPIVSLVWKFVSIIIQPC